MSAVVVSFIAFLLCFLGIGVYSATRKRDTADDYLVASRSIGPWAMALSAVATNNSGFMFIGLIGSTYVEGVSYNRIMGCISSKRKSKIESNVWFTDTRNLDNYIAGWYHSCWCR